MAAVLIWRLLTNRLKPVTPASGSTHSVPCPAKPTKVYMWFMASVSSRPFQLGNTGSPCQPPLTLPRLVTLTEAAFLGTRFRELVSSAAAAAGSAAEAAPAVHTLSAIMPRPATLPFRNVLRENLVDMVRSSHSFCRNATICLYSCFFVPQQRDCLVPRIVRETKQNVNCVFILWHKVLRFSVFRLFWHIVLRFVSNFHAFCIQPAAKMRKKAAAQTLVQRLWFIIFLTRCGH